MRKGSPQGAQLDPVSVYLDTECKMLLLNEPPSPSESACPGGRLMLPELESVRFAVSRVRVLMRLVLWALLPGGLWWGRATECRGCQLCSQLLFFTVSLSKKIRNDNGVFFT